MSIIKQTKDYLAKTLAGSRFVPQGLFEASEYFRHNGPIKFEFKIENDQHIAISTNFRYGSIVTSGKKYQRRDSDIIRHPVVIRQGSKHSQGGPGKRVCLRVVSFRATSTEKS